MRVWTVYAVGIQRVREVGGKEDAQVSDLITWTDGGVMAETENPGDRRQSLASVFLRGR